MPTAHLNIGSNIGDRLANIRQAVAAVERRLGASAVCSAPFDSEPWGYDSDNRFLNVGVNIEVGLRSPHEIMQLLLAAQHEVCPASHRNCTGGYIDRIIDIDFIALDDTVVDTPELTLPHPRMHEREFVLAPMAEIFPEWIHPKLNVPVLMLLRQLSGRKQHTR